MQPTIILVHGAYAESSSRGGVVETLAVAGHRVIACANPLLGVATDAAALTDLVRSVEGPVVLAGHSYGGAVMTNVDPDAGEVVAHVYVAGFALEPGESAGDASALAPGSTLAETLERVPLADGGTDTYIAPDRFHHQFAADRPEEESALMAVTQWPITGRCGAVGLNLAQTSENAPIEGTVALEAGEDKSPHTSSFEGDCLQPSTTVDLSVTLAVMPFRL